MGLLTSKTFNTLDELFIFQLQDLYDAEQRLTKALPKMAEAATSANLKTAFERHLEETVQHVNRLEEAFKSIGETPKSETCEAMKGLISEGDEMVDCKGDPAVRDAALIAAAQRVEHYEIASYGTACSLAKRLRHTLAGDLLHRTLEEEKSADQMLTEIAQSEANVEAAKA